MNTISIRTFIILLSFSTRPFPEKISNFDYEPNLRVLKVTQNGAIRWKSYYWVYLNVLSPYLSRNKPIDVLRNDDDIVRSESLVIVSSLFCYMLTEEY